MDNLKVKLGKRGGAKRVAEELAKIRKTPISPKVVEILEDAGRKEERKKSAKSADLES